ncbi:phage baseplate assembly protein V [uncultured Pseudacidovorax sp.]|uniref:phage baseplate assembly protein V n=1 Tax=uncultured Pseudacidovorax sp. TaxID=679313 RepID=UPI0025E12E7C|nr:phage baseplate assembly protein V [uncultured Pseudacidovorax sp.]
MNERLIQRMLAPAQRRLQNLIARGVVVLSDAAAKMQALQVRLLAGETLDAVEHFEPYGFTSRPKAGAEVLTLSVDGDRSHTLVIVAADRRYRLAGLEEGEMAIHDDQGQSVHLTRGGIVIKGGGLPMLVEEAPTITFKATEKVRFETPRFEVTGLAIVQQLTVGLAGAGVATMNGGTLNFNAVALNYQSCTTTYTGGTLTHDGRNIGGGHQHPETGTVTDIPNP